VTPEARHPEYVPSSGLFVIQQKGSLHHQTHFMLALAFETPAGTKVLSNLNLNNDEGSLWASFFFLSG
jgi:hypothetical protein